MGRSLGGRSRISLPFSSSSPSVGLSNPAIIRSVVVFPQPDGPRNVTNSPLCIVRLKSSTTQKPSSNVRLIFFNSIIFSFAVFLSNASPPHPGYGYVQNALMHHFVVYHILERIATKNFYYPQNR